jgi:Rieske 2Fe-2S family protein
MRRALASRIPGFSLPQELYTDPEMFKLDMQLVYYRDWVFAGHACEVAAPGDFFTLQIGDYPLIVTRDQNGKVHCHHNSCRHRGFKICDAAHGNVKRRFVCPYHQWSYELDGRLARARDMTDTLDPVAFGLKAAHVEMFAGYIFVSVADKAPDFAPVKAMIEPYIAPFDLANAKVAYESRIVENGNWKLVMENNRECYHCPGSHPELCRVFPETPVHSGVPGDAGDEAVEQMIAACEALGLPSRFRKADNHQYRVMRLPFLHDARAMTMTGKPAVAGKVLGRVPSGPNIGDVLLYHYPSTWNHFTADHAISFRVLPLSVNETELVTKWLVPKDAVEGVDYDLKTLTEVWIATNAQDTDLVERNQAGIRSPAYAPGPYSPVHEAGVIQFVDWYCGAVGERLGGQDPRLAEAAE